MNSAPSSSLERINDLLYRFTQTNDGNDNEPGQWRPGRHFKFSRPNGRRVHIERATRDSFVYYGNVWNPYYQLLVRIPVLDVVRDNDIFSRLVRRSLLRHEFAGLCGWRPRLVPLTDWEPVESPYGLQRNLQDLWVEAVHVWYES